MSIHCNYMIRTYEAPPHTPSPICVITVDQLLHNIVSIPTLTVEQLEDAGVLLLDLQVKLGAVTQHDPLRPHLLQVAEYPEGQIQDQAHHGLHRGGGKVHGHGLDDVHLRGETKEERSYWECSQNGASSDDYGSHSYVFMNNSNAIQRSFIRHCDLN